MWDSVKDLVYEAQEVLVSILQAKWSPFVDVKSERGDDGSLPLVPGCHWDLVIYL